MLLGIGLCIVSRLSFDKAIRQYVIVLVSLIFSLLVPYLLGKIHFFKKITWLYATLGIALLSTVLILGEVTHGSKISFSWEESRSSLRNSSRSCSCSFWRERCGKMSPSRESF
jgi:hypothetical protein